MDRRDFLKTVAITGAALTIQHSEAMEVLTQTINKANGANPDLVAVMGGEPEAMFRRAISELGGMKQFVKPGQKVVVKPNIGWDKVPELAGNTNPKLVAEIVKQCFAAGAKEVTVFDHTCDDWQKCYKNSGIEAVAKAAGAKVMPAHLESYYKPWRSQSDYLHEKPYGNCMGSRILSPKRLATMYCRYLYPAKESRAERCRCLPDYED